MPWLGKSDVEARIETIKGAMDDAASDVASRGALLVQTNQRQSATHRPGPLVRTGNLWRGIHALVPAEHTGPGVWTARTTSTVVYGRIQEFGGTIYPKRGPFLVWTDGPRPVTPEGWRTAQKAGLVHRARRVTLPERPYMRPGIWEAAPQYQVLAASRYIQALEGSA